MPQEDAQPYTLVEGIPVETDALRIAEKIHEISPTLRLQYLAENAKLGDPPFQVVETGRDGKDYVAFYAWKLDDRLIERIHAADTQRVDVLTGLEENNKKVRRWVEKHHKDANAEGFEMMHAALNSHKDTYIINDDFTGKRIKVSSHLPPEVTELD